MTKEIRFSSSGSAKITTGDVVEQKRQLPAGDVGSSPAVARHPSTDESLRWALVGLDLVENGLRNRRGLTNDDVEMQNLRSAKASIEAARERLSPPSEKREWQSCTRCGAAILNEHPEA